MSNPIEHDGFSGEADAPVVQGRIAFRNSIRSSLFFKMVIIMVPIVIGAGMLIDYLFRQTIQHHIDSELNNATASILNTVRTAAAVSIKNRLRAIAEKNRDIAGTIWAQHLSGALTREAAIERIREILLSQRIGNTGYIYCIDSAGTAVVHPKNGVENENWFRFAFIQEQVRRREGYLEYMWQNPGETQPRPKALYMSYFEPLDWIISVSTYKSEFNALIDLADFREGVLRHRFGTTGYAYVIGMDGDIKIHPFISGKNIREIDENTDFVNEMLKRDGGRIRYMWRNPGESVLREKIVFFQHLPEFKWIVAASCYADEVFRPLKIVRTIWGCCVAGALAMAFSLAYFVSGAIVRPIRRIGDTMAKGAEGDLSVRCHYRSRDEIGHLASLFDLFMEKLEHSKNSLGREIDTRIETERKLRNRERDLANTNQMLKLVLDTIPTRVYWKDLDLRYMGCNRIFARDAGEELPGGIAGKQDGELPWAEMSETYMAEERRIIETRESVVQRDESRIQGEQEVKWLRTSKIPLISSGGEVIGILGMYEDITDQKNAEKRIAESEAKYRTLFESSPDAIVMLNLEGRFIDVNRAFFRAFRYDRDDLATMQIYDLIPEAERAREAPFWEDLKMGIDSITGNEKIYLNKLGESMPVAVRGWLMRNEESQPVAMGLFIRDVSHEIQLRSEKKILERQLQQTQKMEAIGTLAGGIAHDFNNILGGIIGYAEIALIKKDIAPQKIPDYLNSILDAGNRAKDLVQQILQFSRQTSEEQSPCDIAAIVMETLRLIEATIPKEIVVEREMALTNGQIMGNPTQIHQVLMNLCTNAYQAMRENGGTLSIRLDTETVDSPRRLFASKIHPGRYARLRVSDSGCGIAPENLARIFDPYYSTKSIDEGTGLGLAVTLGIVRGHKGGVHVESEPGRGSVFTVYFPLASHAAAIQQRMENSVPRGRGERVLIVDDETMFRDVVANHLMDLGYRVDSHGRSLDALAAFRSNPEGFDLIVTDQTMPEMTGIRLATEVRRLNAAVPILLCTGFSEKVTEETIREMGINAFLMKPVSRTELGRTVRTVLDDREGIRAS